MFALLRFAWLGAREVSGLPVGTHCELLPVICDSIPFLDIVFCRITNFINCCLNSSSEIVNYVARHGVFFHECALQFGAMHYITVTGIERWQTIYQLLILVLLTDVFDVVTRMNLYRELVHYFN